MKKSGLKKIIIEAILEKLNEDDSHDYKLGVNMAGVHRTKGRKFSKEELYRFSPAFIKGYKYVMGDSLYNKINDFATDFFSKLGSSRVKEL